MLTFVHLRLPSTDCFVKGWEKWRSQNRFKTSSFLVILCIRLCLQTVVLNLAIYSKINESFSLSKLEGHSVMHYRAKYVARVLVLRSKAVGTVLEASRTTVFEVQK